MKLFPIVSLCLLSIENIPQRTFAADTHIKIDQFG